MKHNNSGIILMILAVMAASFFWIEPLKDGVRSGLHLCAAALIPSLFPFSVGTNLLLAYGFDDAAEKRFGHMMRRIFGLPGQSAAPFLLGLLGGYPLGAQITAQLRKNGSLSRAAAEKTSFFCNNAGPAFIIGAVGAGVFHSLKIGAVLYFIHVVSAISAGLILRNAPSGLPDAEISSSRSHAAQQVLIGDVLGKSSTAMLRISGIVVFFSALCAVLRAVIPLHRLPRIVAAALYGSLELTGGCYSLIGADPGPAFSVAAVLLGWGGICVHMQALDAFSGTDITIQPYICGKLLQMLLSYILSILFRIMIFQDYRPISLLISLVLLAGFPIILIISKKRTGNPIRI